ncbi:hypothetical protein E3T39_14715 [Cryobacterium suzukii]|uniref:Uncharacterized protein n=1 Tax=Cryobacterium suzukii TaxID=1259198 RepID=A0A4V3ISA6_9MICO|nr:hypothetical protein E3T39_14715 [Cryobacterium suzukii]
MTLQASSGRAGIPRCRAFGVRVLGAFSSFAVASATDLSKYLAGNLGYDVTVALDATRTFDLATTIPGLGTITHTADERQGRWPTEA